MTDPNSNYYESYDQEYNYTGTYDAEYDENGYVNYNAAWEPSAQAEAATYEDNSDTKKKKKGKTDQGITFKATL
jgi:hypothetical protein